MTLPHAVARLRTARLARASKPFRARGGSDKPRCDGCRLAVTHCLCAMRPAVVTNAGMCLIMADIEMLKPSNTGWLIADVVADTFAFGWARTEVDPALLALLADPQWQPVVVFPGEFVEPERVVTRLTEQHPSVQAELVEALPFDPSTSSGQAKLRANGVVSPGSLPKRPLFVLLDATWPEARKMFRKSPYLDKLPVLSLSSEQISRYKLRRSKRDDHFCTSEVGSLCLELAGERHAAELLTAYLDVFTHHYLQAKRQLPADPLSEAHRRLRGLSVVD